MIKKIRVAIKYIFYLFLSFFLKSSKVIKAKSLLIIRLDAIGDYVLFRNFIEVLKKSEKFKEYNITLLGNSAWKSLSKELDSKYVDKFIWLDRNRFNKDFVYSYKKLKEIVSNSYEVVLNPVYSREFFCGDIIIKLVNAKEKIGSIGDLSKIGKLPKNISDKYYDKLIPAKDEIIFEFYRNKEFFENLLAIKIDIKKPYIKLKSKEISFSLPKNYAVLFIGASANYRKWSIEGFAEIGEYLREKYGYEIVLCGAQNDKDNALKFRKYFNGDYVDLVGKTNLIELLYVIYNGNLIISNETSAPHFSVSLGMKNIFVISNGNHYGRFAPYPKEVCDSYHIIYHPEIEKDLADYKRLSNSYRYGSDLDINDISFEMVKNKIDEVLSMC